VAGGEGQLTRKAEGGGAGFLAGMRSVAGSWRVFSVVLLTFSSGLPLGLVWIAIPAWMARVGVDIKVIGLFTLAQAPWSFKLLWSPSMDRYPLPFLGRKRGWILVCQVALFALGLWLSGVSDHPEAVWVIAALAFAIAFASASQDIAIDAYAVEVLRREEHGIATGARFAFYRAAMLVSGGAAITFAAQTSWTLVNALLALAYVPFMVVTWRSPEPEVVPEPPKTLRDAVFGPFVGLLARHRALEILAFVVLYKLSDNLTQALTRPFLVQVGFGDFDVGIATATIGQVAAVAGTFVGGLLTEGLGLGRALWIFGFLQLFSNLGYAAVAQVGVNRPLMYAAQAFELGSSGLGSGAFGVLLLRLTQKRFSATQYALLSSLFTLPRILAGPVAGVLADAIGWRNFFVLTVPFGVPGLVMLARFVPWSVRDPLFEVEEPARGAPLTPARLVLWSLVGVAVTGALGVGAVGLVGALSGLHAGRAFDLVGPLRSVLLPASLGEWLRAAGIGVLALLAGLGTAAILVARRGLATAVPPAPPPACHH
jgi:PAT family beta-lactamase induction signal transducer AmpG